MTQIPRVNRYERFFPNSLLPSPWGEQVHAPGVSWHNPVPCYSSPLSCYHDNVCAHVNVPRARDSTRFPIIHQTRDVHPMSFQCWARVTNGGPTLDRHWVNMCFFYINRAHDAVESNHTSETIKDNDMSLDSLKFISFNKYLIFLM